MKKYKGFTLIELVLTVGLLSLAFGVTSDLLITIVRSQTKTQIMNSVEQQANFVSLRIEKDLRSAVTVSTADGGNTLTIINRSNGITTYTFNAATSTILDNISFSPGPISVPINDTASPGGVGIRCYSGKECFKAEGSDPTVVTISLTLFPVRTINGSLVPDATGTVDINETIVVRNYTSN